MASLVGDTRAAEVDDVVNAVERFGIHGALLDIPSVATHTVRRSRSATQPSGRMSCVLERVGQRSTDKAAAAGYQDNGHGHEGTREVRRPFAINKPLTSAHEREGQLMCGAIIHGPQYVASSVQC